MRNVCLIVFDFNRFFVKKYEKFNKSVEIEAFKKFDFETARKEQLRSIKLVNILVKRGYMASAKAMMGMLGVDVGSPRLPNVALKQDELASLRSDLEKESYI